jgi:hypothetical protein
MFFYLFLALFSGFGLSFQLKRRLHIPEDVSSKGKMIMYIFFTLFSGLCPSFLLKRC